MIFLDILLGIFLVWFDQFTKGLAVSRLKGQPAYSLIDGVLELQYLENYGMAFGMLQNQKILILLMDIIFMLVLLFFLLKMPVTPTFRMRHVLLVFLVSGGVGNMLDRLRLDGDTARIRSMAGENLSTEESVADLYRRFGI